MANTHKLFLIIAIPCLILLIPLYLFLEFISDLITIPGTVILVILLFILLLNTFTRLLIFPGAFLIWRRSLESHFCKEMSAQLLQKIYDIRVTLQILLGQLQEELPVDSLVYSKRLMIALIDNFLTLKEDYRLTESQSTLMQHLVNLQLSLQESKIIIADSEPLSLWDWLESVSSPT